MIRRNHISIVYTKGSNNRTQSINDDYTKGQRGGILLMTCPQSGSEVRIPFRNERERKEWIWLKKEIKRELV